MNPRWLYHPSLVVDGNFKAEQIKMRRPEDDVALIDGEGYMVTDGPYCEHLREAVEAKEVVNLICLLCSADATCSSEIHLLQSQSSQSSKCKPAQLICYWYRCLCMWAPWLFCASFSCGFQKGEW